MIETSDWLALGAAAVLVLVTGVLVMGQAALRRVTRVRALAWQEEGRRGAARLARLLEYPEGPLLVAALLVLGGRVAAAALAGVVGWRAGGEAGAAVAGAALFLALLTMGELVPRRLGLRHPEGAALRLAGVLAAAGRFAPLAMLARTVVGDVRARNAGNSVVEHEPAGAEANGEGDDVDEEEQQLIHSVFEFSDTIVREVMVPRTDMVAVDAGTTIESALDAAISRGFSRLPVFRERQDDIVGLVYVKDLIRTLQQGGGGSPAAEVVRKAVFVPEQKRVAELLREMQTRKFHMAVVIDEYGGVAGIVTLEDLLEELVGEIVDEYDVEEPHVEELDDGVLRVAGRTPIDEISELLGVELPDEEWDTVGGLIFDLVGHVPAEGESVSFQGIEFEAERVQGRRIVSVRVHRAPESREPAAGAR